MRARRLLGAGYGSVIPGISVLILLAGLAGCAKPPPPAPEPAPAPPTALDGRYRGVARLVQGGRGCPRSGARVREVRDGMVSMNYLAGLRQIVQLNAQVQPDGTLHAEDGVGTLDGTLRDGRLEVTVISPLCEHRWFMSRVDDAGS